MKLKDPDWKLPSNSTVCQIVTIGTLNVGASHFGSWWSPPSPGTVLALMRRGEVQTMTRTDRGETTVDWREGDVLCLRPATPRLHRIVSPGNVVYSYVTLTATALGGVDVLSLYDLPPKYTGTAASRIGDAIGEVTGASELADPMKRDIARQLSAYQLVSAMLEELRIRSDAAQTMQGITRVSPALEHLAAHYSDAPDINALASLCCLSPSRFHAVFKLATGGTPYSVLTRHRLQHAAQQLATTDLNVREVGEMVGWPDPFHFSRTFKRHYGLSPRDYRARASAGLDML